MPSDVAVRQVEHFPSQYDLINKAQAGDTDAMERLVEQNLGLARMLVNHYCGKGMEYDDLYQIACIGIVKAVKNFNTSLNVRFSTYAVPVILGELKRSFRDGGSIKVSRSLKENGLKVLRAKEILMQRNGCEPSLTELSEETGFPPEEIAMMMEALTPPISFSAEVGDTDMAQEQLFGVDHTEQMITALTLKETMAQLSLEERQLITLRYFHGMTQQNAARVLKSTQVQVSRMEKKILKKMQIMLKENI